MRTSSTLRTARLARPAGLAILVAAGCAAAGAPARSTPGAAAPGIPLAIPDAALGLSPGSVFSVPVPPRFVAEDSAPGDRRAPPRLGPAIPPVVPHAVADFLPITPTQNSCVDCHQTDQPKQAGGPTPIPSSHFVDQRRAPGATGAVVAGARWICTSCHVGRTDAPPLVGNAYRP